MDEKIQLLANVVESSDDAIISKSLDGVITSWNKGAELIYGYSAEEIIGKNISILAPPQLKDEITQLIKKIKDGKNVSHYDTIRIRKDSKKVDVSITMSPIFDNIGNLIGISTIARDITKQKKSELALKESEEKFREVFNNANDMIVLNLIKDDGLPGKFIDVNEIGISRLGYSRDEFLNMTHADIIVPEKRSEMQENTLKLFEKGYIEFEIIYMAKDGKKIPVEVNNHLFELRGKKIALAISRDITERKKAEESLIKAYDELELKVQKRTAEIEESKENLRLTNRYNRELIKVSIDPLVTISAEGKLKDVNKAVELITGYSRKQLIGTDFSDYFTDPIKAKAGYKKVFQEGFVKDYPLEIQHKNGDITPVLYNASIYKDEKDQIIGVFAAARDISQLKNAEIVVKKHMDSLEITVKRRTAELSHANVILKAEIKERNRMEKIIHDNILRMNLALESADMGAWDLDILKDTAIRTLDHDKIFGYDSLLPGWGLKNLFKHILPEDREYVHEQFEKSYETDKLYFQCRIIRADKEIRWIESYGNVYKDNENVPIRMLGVISDITQRKDAENQLLRAIGEKEILLREFQHHVKNNLQIISSFLSLQSSQVFDKRDASLFTNVQDRVKSMALIHNNLYKSEDLSSIQFKEYVKTLISQLFATHSELSKNVKLVTDIIDVNFNMETAIPLGLIISEIVTNSLKHAFPDFKGEISISVHSKGEEIEIIIKDNGVGLPKDMNIKKPKKLGLQLVNSLVEQLEATIELNKNHGTKYKIKFKERL